jgi:UTP--glucose-1-phosphate uridylyltransferase
MPTPQHPSCLILPAAGLGTRLRRVAADLPGLPADLPKELLPIRGRPAIQYALAEAEAARIPEAIVILRPGKELVRRVIEEPGVCARLFPQAAPELERLASGLRVRFLQQKEPLGECDAIALARPHAGSGPFAVLYPDNVRLPGPGMVAQLCAAFGKRPGDLVGLMPVTAENAGRVSDSGRVDLERTGQPGLWRIREFLPKGPGRFVPRRPVEWRTCGSYATLPHFFEWIERTRAAGFTGELTDGKVRRAMLREGVEFYGVELSGEIHDIGNPEGYRGCSGWEG